VLTDPVTHCAIDGTGWVPEAAARAPLTEVVGGAQFIRDRGIQFPPFGPEHLTNSLATWPSLPHRRPKPEPRRLDTWRAAAAVQSNDGQSVAAAGVALSGGPGRTHAGLRHCGPMPSRSGRLA